jgi:predicted transcriptional regulator
MQRAGPIPHEDLEHPWLNLHDTLEQALPLFEKTQAAQLPVVDEGQIVAYVSHVDALRAYAQALAQTAAEEHS